MMNQCNEIMHTNCLEILDAAMQMQQRNNKCDWAINAMLYVRK